jgi:hypothetical protein
VLLQHIRRLQQFCERRLVKDWFVFFFEHDFFFNQRK